jgi:hypothetical protein
LKPPAGLVSLLLLMMAQFAHPQSRVLTFPDTVTAGTEFSVQSSGSGRGTLYIVGLGQVVKRDLQLGQSVTFDTGELHNAGHYLVILTGDSTETDALEITPDKTPADLSFLARPSRLPVGLHDGITGAVYVFDAYHNLITAPTSINFQLASPSGNPQSRTVSTRAGAAWTEFDSTAHQGNAKFTASAGLVSSSRVIGEVPGDPCGLRMSATPAGRLVKLQTEPIRDCSGNAVPDGTVVTFTQTYNGDQTTVDVPIKRGIAEVQVPAHPGATITVASGVVMGNQIHWGNR